MGDAFPVSGQIDPKAFPYLLAELHRRGATGSLKVEGPTYQKALYFRGGRILFGSSNDPRDQLGAILIESGKITPEQLEDVNTKVGPGNPLAKVLADTGFVNQRELSEAARAKVERILSDLVAYTEGSFEFEDGVLPKGAVDLKLSTPKVILAAVRRVGDRTFALRHLEGMESVLARVSGQAERFADLQPESGGIPEMLDGQRSLREVAGDTHLDDFEAAKIACALLFLGLADRIQPETPPLFADGDVAHTEAMPLPDLGGDAGPAFFVPPGEGFELADPAAFAPDADAASATMMITRDKLAQFQAEAAAAEEPAEEANSTLLLTRDKLAQFQAQAEAAEEPAEEANSTLLLTRDKLAQFQAQAEAEDAAPEFSLAPPAEEANSTVLLTRDKLAQFRAEAALGEPEGEELPPPMFSDAPARYAPPPEPPDEAPPFVPEPELPMAATVSMESFADEEPPPPPHAPPSEQDREALAELLGPSGSGRPRKSVVIAPWPATNRPPVPAPDNRRWILLGTGIVAAVVVGAGAFVIVGRKPTPPPTTIAAAPPTTAAPAPSTVPEATAPAASTPPSSVPVPATAPAATPAPATAPPATAPPATVPPVTRPATVAGGGSGRALLDAGQVGGAAAAFLAEAKGAAPGSTTIQLLVACSVETVDKAVKAVGSTDLKVIPIDYKGRSCYRILWGFYPDAAGAQTAAQSLPAYFHQPGVNPRVMPVAEVLR